MSRIGRCLFMYAEIVKKIRNRFIPLEWRKSEFADELKLAVSVKWYEMGLISHSIHN